MVSPQSPALPRLDRRDPESHKGNYGRCLLVGGSIGMCGAIALAGRAALRGGAGLVTVATPTSCLETVAALEPCYMTLPLACEADGRLADSAWHDLMEQTADCVACGPGMGKAPAVGPLVKKMYQTFTQPMVVDADALNALAQMQVDLTSAAGPRVLTPHPGEFKRLGKQQDSEFTDVRSFAVQWARQHQVVLVLKGHRTLVTDGTDQFDNSTGNPGMATGGSGDVLTGLLLALIGQGLEPLLAARLAVYLHGSAGDLAAADLGQVSLIASDLVNYLPTAIRHYQDSDG